MATDPEITAAATSAGSGSKKVKSNQDSDHTNELNQDSCQTHKLIPGLPNEIAELCLSSVHPSILYSVSHSWRSLVYSPDFSPFLSLYALLTPSFSNHGQIQSNSSSIEFYSFDPISANWEILPPPPLCLIHRHPSYISRSFPIQSVSVSGNLVLLAATTPDLRPALSCPLVFNPLSKTWVFGPPFDKPRRWCATGVSKCNVYVAGGIGLRYTTDVARSVLKLDFKNRGIDFGCGWEKKKMLKDERFSRDAIEAIGYRNKLYMVNVKGRFAKEGIVYDIVNDSWSAMPEGMKSGWKGPVASMDEDVMFMVDEVKGELRRYSLEMDCWDEVMKSDELKGAEQISAGGGRVCVVCGDGGIAVVDVVRSPAKLWLVDTPPGLNAVAVHILPRMNPVRYGQ